MDIFRKHPIFFINAESCVIMYKSVKLEITALCRYIHDTRIFVFAFFTLYILSIIVRRIRFYLFSIYLHQHEDKLFLPISRFISFDSLSCLFPSSRNFKHKPLCVPLQFFTSSPSY